LTTALAIIGAIAGAIAFGYYGYTQVAGDPTLTTVEKVATVALYTIGGAVAGGFFGAGLGYMATLIGGAAVGMAGGEAALAMATAISVEEAVALGVALGVAGAAASGGDNIHYSRNSNNNMPWYGKPGSTVYQNGSVGQYDSRGHLIGRKDYEQRHYVKNAERYCDQHTHAFKWWKYKGKWWHTEIWELPF